MIKEYIPYLMEVDVFSRKWTFLIIMLLFFYGSANFNMLKSNVRPITSKVLSERLRFLETSGVVLKNVVVERPKRVEYELTEKGRSLMGALINFFVYVDKKAIRKG
ncbi:MAG: helix-turn-helix transcriptional regulator [Candidatus Aenigmarchaeota archaeon]|nr:helix-turn-helix transcriptional regulator [Candidatus Aenigmarchaeota archaeon]